MWYRTVTRKELVELFLSPQSDRPGESAFNTSIPKKFGASDSVLLGWGEDPSASAILPCLAVVDDADLADLLALLNANPQGPSPVSAFCRFIGKEHFLQYLEPPPLDFTSPQIAPFIALSFAESLVLSDGQIKLADLGPAICQRTLSFTWAKAIAAKVPFSQLGHLVDSWAEAYAMTSDNQRATKVADSAGALFSVLRVVTELAVGSSSTSPEAAFCRALQDRSKSDQETAWKRLSSSFSEMPSLTAISEATREERGQIFQHAVRVNADPFTLALLAAQISPGTLDHIEIVQLQRDPRVVYWYTVLAALARPQALLSANGALGRRLERIASRLPTLEDFPECDLSFVELRVLSRLGLEYLSRRLEHAGEMSVELIPLITASFRFPTRGGRSAEASDQEKASKDRYNAERQRDRLLSIARSIEEIAYSQQLDLAPPDSRMKRGGVRK